MSFDETISLRFLGLPIDGNYRPSPARDPIDFLKLHIHVLPPHILRSFSAVITAKQRSLLSVIRNRRLRYSQSNPPELSFTGACQSWPTLWEGRERRGIEEGNEEKEWARAGFLGGITQHVGRLGALLGEYEEEREADRVSALRREAAANAFVPEEDSDSDDEEVDSHVVSELDSDDDARALFERRVREKFIYGLLENIDYDKVDWDESMDGENDRDAQERWFDEEEES